MLRRLPLRMTIGASLLVVIAASPVYAQARFELLTRDTVAAVSGLQILTIRDSRLSACYTVFVFAPLSTVPTEPSPSAEAIARAEVLRQIRDATAKREQQLSDLRSRIGGQDRDPIRNQRNVVEFEAARKQIQDDYERVIGPLIGGGFPWSTPIFLGRTGNSEDTAEAIRRALMVSDSDPGGLSSQTVSLLQRMIDAPKLAVSGPTPCDPSVSAKTGTR